MKRAASSSLSPSAVSRRSNTMNGEDAGEQDANVSEQGDADASASVPTLATCTKCDEEMEFSKTLSAGRVGYRICKLCFNSARSLQNHYKKRGKKSEWDNMAPAKKKRMIVENKFSGGIRGKERNVLIREEARSFGYCFFFWGFESDIIVW